MRCVLFDSDGTLVDSEGLAGEGLSQAFLELGCELDAGELVRRFRGWQLSAQLELLSRENTLVLPGDFVARYRALLSELIERELQAIDGVPEALSRISLPMGVVSNGPRNKIELALRVCGLSTYFGDNIFSAYELDAWKPDPALYLLAARAMGFAPAECAVVEDTLIGVEAGVRAGMRTLFYNPLGEDCPFAETISFRAMSGLPSLLQDL